MEHLEEEVKELIRDRYHSLAEFARSIGLSEQTLYSVLNNGLAGGSMTPVMPIVSALGLDPFLLMEGRVSPKKPHPGSIDVPLYESFDSRKLKERIPAESAFPIPAKLADQFPDAFMLRVQGESMNRILPDGCYALIDPCSEASSYRYVYALIIGEGVATVSHVRKLENGFELIPDSIDPTFRPTVIDYGVPGADKITIVGRIVWYCPSITWHAVSL